MSHLKEYLNYYKRCNSPGYAVLVTGEWGVGKTFQVKQVLKEDERYYVSLFGSQSADDIYSAVLAVMDPTLAKTKKVLVGLGDTSTFAGGMFAFAGLLPKAMNAILRHQVDIERTLVFDDLERCGLCLRDTLGIINMYVEHHGCRVVVIAHDEKLAKKFLKMKEKIFGQTIEVEPQIAGAFDDFCSHFSCENNGFLKDHRSEIIGVFEASGAKSLRIMKYVIEDLTRLHKILDKPHLKHTTAMSELVCLFSALNIEIRTGQLRKEDLQNRKDVKSAYYLNRAGSSGGSIEKPPLFIASERYKSVDLESNLLHDELIVQMLIEGKYDRECLRVSLDNHHHFLKPADAPPWKLVWNFDELEDDVVEQAVSLMQKQFDNRDVTDSGEMLHIFSLRMLMGENSILPGDIDAITTDCIKYIDDLLSANRLPPRELHWEWTRSFVRSHDSCIYWVAEANKESFNKIVEHLISAREKALERKFPEKTEMLLNLVKTDGQAFSEQISHTDKGENPYALIPVLSHIPAGEFVEAWLESPKDNWQSICWALESRYEGRRLADELKTEKDWLTQVLNVLDQKMEETEGFKALRIKRAIPKGLRELVEI